MTASQGPRNPATAQDQTAGGAAAAAVAGLTSAQAAQRLAQYGPNAVAEVRPNQLLALARMFWGLVPWMLEAAIGIELYLGRWVEAGVIGALLVFNAIIGFRQQARAQQAVALLRQRLTVNARVRRDGRWQELPAAHLVPDDLVHLRVGDIVPADLLLSDGRVHVDQSQLTGESALAGKGAGDTAYTGSVVSRGEASGVVTATGSRTYFGRTAELVKTAEAPRRLEILIVRITKYLAALVIALAVAVLVYQVATGAKLINMLPFDLMLLVASVPVALPAMFTMSAAVGARALAQNGILVTRLSAIEDAAAMDVICLDKTGTITQNRLSVEAVELSGPASPGQVLRLAALASDAATQDPIDLAILAAASEQAPTGPAPARVSFVPFDPDTKRSEAIVRQDGQVTRVIKGAPAVVADLARLPWRQIAPAVERLSAGGARVLAVAGPADGDGTDGAAAGGHGAGSSPGLRLAGLIALADPPRPESAELIRRLRGRGVRVLLVTGDGEDTARAVAAKIGITGPVAPPGTLRENLDPATASQFDVYAGVLPEHKYYLVQALQQAGHVTGMTGDGVNDAPALRQADVGVAVAAATDVARGAASLVLTHPGIGEIAAAVDGSRRIYQRMKTFILTMMARKMSIPVFLAGAVLAAGVLVQTPTQIVLLMFATDIATMSLATDRVTPSPAPDKWSVPSLAATGAGLAALLVALNTAVYASRYLFGLTLPQTQTLVFVWLVFGGAQAMLYLTRTRRWFWDRPYPGRWLAAISLLDIIVVAVLAWQGWLMAPLPFGFIAAAFGLAAVFLLAADLLKIGLMRPAASHGARPGAGEVT
jgi:H+-transporting ATPase